MSRVGRKPIPLPHGVEVQLEGRTVRVRGPRGALERELHPRVQVEVAEGEVRVRRPSDGRLDRSLHGLTRTLLANMVEGVTRGFAKELEVQGLGYRVLLQGQRLTLHLGFSRPISFSAPEGVRFEIDQRNRNLVRVLGIDKEKVGRVAAELRALKPPEPYKGKGVRYVGEAVRRKVGKAGV
ncbi:MAG: 50S ribosomal protein L6 [Nitrospinota bacterium]